VIEPVWSHSFPAPAKINLFLHVVGRRPDGYHRLQTAFRLLEYGDVLHFSPRDDGVVCRATPYPEVPEEADLCLRAARALQREAGVRRGVMITLEKRLPLGGGLGGGSSDAATTLLALNRLWAVHMQRADLQRLALTLGADVPFFIFGRSAFGEEVGEVLRAIDLPPAWYVVIEPKIAVSTAMVFAAEDLTRDTEPIKITDFSASCSKLLGHNDLQPVVCRRYPEVARVVEWLGRFAPARMSGSGACVFAAFHDEDAARAVLADIPPPWRGWAARGLDRHPLAHFAD
jgi:4-diphosphocytidyl-2-C-methyl-D-erythritol kinase